MNGINVENSFLANKTVTHLPKRRPVDIEFQNVCFSVPDGRKSSKAILKNVSGNFFSGQLTAIMGPSGGGKTTLLNILAGYNFEGMTGNILVNGKKCEVEEFCKMSRYIMQQDCLQRFLTVYEYVRLAADLKLGSSESEETKEIMITELLDFLRLTRCRDTRAKNLSGGERKRLSIALELLNNPSVIFLDEPTTGLDDVGSSQCIGLLKLLAKEGRNVIAAIHTPSARVFSIFDHVYVINQGECVYQGCRSLLVPFLGSIGLVCPTSHTPIDFMMEVCSQQYGDFHRDMVSSVENGLKTVSHENFENPSFREKNKVHSREKFDQNENYVDMKDTSSSFSYQVYRLTLRMWLQMIRDKNSIQMRIFVYLFLAIVYGISFYRIGNNGSKTLYNLGFIFVCLVSYIFNPMMPVLMYFPVEVEVLKREHFNKWYGFGAYYISFSLVNNAILLILTALYVFIVYTSTAQPMECERIILFFLLMTLTGLVAESIGIIYGSLFKFETALFAGIASTVPSILLAIYSFGGNGKATPAWIHFIMYFGYLTYSLEGLMYTIFENRSTLPCPDDEDFCQYTDVKYFLKEVGMANGVLWIDITALIVFVLILRIIGYYCLKQRVIPNKLSKTMNALVKITKSNFTS